MYNNFHHKWGYPLERCMEMMKLRKPESKLTTSTFLMFLPFPPVGTSAVPKTFIHIHMTPKATFSNPLSLQLVLHFQLCIEISHLDILPLPQINSSEIVPPLDHHA